jgi:hypothetical protein
LNPLSRHRTAVIIQTALLKEVTVSSGISRMEGTFFRILLVAGDGKGGLGEGADDYYKAFVDVVRDHTPSIGPICDAVRSDALSHLSVLAIQSEWKRERLGGFCSSFPLYG